MLGSFCFLLEIRRSAEVGAYRYCEVAVRLCVFLRANQRARASRGRRPRRAAIRTSTALQHLRCCASGAAQRRRACRKPWSAAGRATRRDPLTLAARSRPREMPPDKRSRAEKFSKAARPERRPEETARRAG